MHGVVGTVTMEQDSFEVQRQVLTQEIAPRVRQTPGFVAGYWTYDAENSAGHVMVLFDSDDSARSFRAGVLEDAAARERRAQTGVEFQDLVVVEVIAEAHA